MLLVLLLAGCVSKKQAELQAHQAYGRINARRQAMAGGKATTGRRARAGEQSCDPWTEGLTLAQAIVDATLRLYDPKIRAGRSQRTVD